MLSAFCNAQTNNSGKKSKYADPTHYLIDSLNLNDLSKADKTLLDSKLPSFHKAKHDTSKINVIEEIIEDMIHEDWKKYQYFQYDLIVEALEKKSSTEVTNKLKMSLGTALNNIGYIYNNQGRIEKSLEYHLESLKIREEIQHDEGIATSLLNIGSIYDNQKSYEKALEYYHNALKIYEKAGSKSRIAICINNIGTVKKEQGLLDESLRYLKKALTIYEKINDEYGMAVSLNNIGIIHEQKGKLKTSLSFYEKSLKIRKKIGQKRSLSIAMNNLGSVHMDLGNWQKAKEYLTEALKLASESGHIDQIGKSASNLHRFYKQQKNFEKSLDMYELFIQMRDSITNQANYKASIELNAKYEYEKQRVTDSIRSLEAEKVHLSQLALEEEKTQKKAIELTAQKRQKWVLFIGLGLAALFGFLMLQRFRVAKRQKEVINQQKQLVEEQKNETEKQKNQIEHQHFQLEETHKQISDSINYAERLQKAILPSQEDLKINLGNSFVFFQPKDTVSGDFYWTQNIDGNIFIAVADCTGHGVPGAMVSVVCSNALNRSVKEFHLTKPSEILDKTRELVIETFSRSGGDVKDGMDISLIKKGQKKITFAGAYNPLWLVRKTEYLTEQQRNSKNTVIDEELSLIEFKANKQPVGLFDYTTPFDEVEIPIYDDDTVYLFTDGFADQFGGKKGKKFKYKPFKSYLVEINSLNMNRQKEALNDQFNSWKGNLEQLDDVCIIGIKY